jgi:hypothetical protein
MAPAGCYGTGPAGDLNRDRGGATRRGAITELAEFVTSRCPYRAVVEQKEGVEMPRRNRPGIADADNDNRGGAVQPGAIAELAKIITPRRSYRAIGLNDKASVGT